MNSIISEKLKFSPESKNRQFIIILLSFSIYLSFYLLVSSSSSMPPPSIVCIIPVIMAGVYFGFNGGMLAALLCFYLNTFLYNVLGFKGIDIVLRSGGYLEMIALVLSGGVVGKLKDMKDEMDEQVRQLELMQNEIKAEKEKFKTYIDMADIIIMILDKKLNVKMINKKGEAIFGLTKKEIKNKNWKEFVSSSDKQRIINMYSNMIGRGISLTFCIESKVITPYGTNRIISWRNSVLKDKNGIVNGVICTGEDVTRKKAVEIEKRKLKTQLNTAEKTATLGKLAGEVAHEINNPLTSVLTSSQLICEGLSSDNPLKPDIVQIAEDAKRIRSIVKDFLGFAKSRNYNFKEHALIDIIENAFKIVGRFKLRNISITRKYLSKTETVCVSRFHIEEVFVNIIINALHSMEGEGELIVETKDAAGYVLVSFRDNGRGIAENDMPKIFEPYYTTKEKRGTGLGLSSSAIIIEKHGGKINAFSEGVGKGAVFTVLLPVNEREKIQCEEK